MKSPYPLILAEMYGTFLLVFLGTGSIVFNPLGGIVPIALAFGLAVMIAIYSVGPISGAHLNPIVSLSFWMQRNISLPQLGLYVLSQLLGALLASFIVWFASANSAFAGVGASTFVHTTPSWLALGFEFVGSFMLVFVVLSVSKSKSLEPLSGLLIGLSLTGLIIVIGPFSSASFNPVRSLLPALFEQGQSLEQLWVFILGPTLGSLFATWLFQLVDPRR